MKIFRVVRIEADGKQLQKVVKILDSCMVKCQMKFYIDKCQVLHIAENSCNYIYVILFRKAIEESSWAIIVKNKFPLEILT